MQLQKWQQAKQKEYKYEKKNITDMEKSNYVT